MVKQDEQTASGTGQTQTTQGGGAITGDAEVEIKTKEAEKQDLAALESLLAKAQKARDIQTKIDEATSKADQKKKISKTPLPVITKPPQKQPMQHTAKQMLSKALKPQPKQSVPIRKPVTQKPAIKSTYSASYGRSSSAKSLVRPTSSRESAKMYLDSVLSKDKKNGTASKGMSRKQGHISSRMEAGPSDKATQRLATAENLNLERKDSSTRTRSALESHHDLQIALSSEKDSQVSEKTDNVKKSTECSGESQEGKLEVDNMRQLALNDGFGKLQSVTGRPGQSSVLGRLDHQSKAEERVFLEGKEDWLDPLAEGAEFTLPAKYHKLKSTSTRLYSELRKIVETDDKPWPCEHFVDRLEAEFDVGNVSSQRETQDKVNRLLEDHEKLAMLTIAVVTRSYNLKDDSSWQEVYKCYRHWQIVLSKFNELQRRTQQLLQVIGGIITVVLLELLEKKGGAPGKTGAGKNFKKQPTEHDERF